MVEGEGTILLVRLCLALTQQAQIALDDGQMDDAQIVEGQFFVARCHRPALLEPADAAFDDVAAAIVGGIVADRTARRGFPRSARGGMTARIPWRRSQCRIRWA